MVALVALAIGVLGVLSTGSLKQELMPSLTAPVAVVTVQSPGLAPEEMAQLVTVPVEQAVSGVAGVTDVTSTTSSGNAEISAQWAFGANDDETVRAIRSAAEALTASLPAGSTVQVSSGGSDEVPALIVSAGSSGDPDAFAQALAQTVVPTLRGLPGARDVTLTGVESRRIVIALRPADVDRLKVDTAALASLVKTDMEAVPAGEARSDAGPVAVTVGTSAKSVDDIAALAVPTADGSTTVQDFADVSIETVPATSISRVNGKPMLTLQITPTRDANVVNVSHAVNAELERVGPGLGADFVTVFDQAPFIEQSVHDLSVEGGLGLLFAVIVILAFLRSWRSTLIAAISIPLSLLIALLGL